MNKINYKPKKQQRNGNKSFSLFSILCALFYLWTITVTPVLAETVQNSQTPTIEKIKLTQQTKNQITQISTSMSSDELQDRASMWGLTTDEFKRYLWLIKNTPSEHWYKNLDPAEVLALNAKDPREMMKYAKQQARNMHVRVTRELAFNKIYSQAYKVLYPHERPIMTPEIPEKNLQSANLQPGDKIWLFVGIHTPLGSFAYQHLIKVVQATSDTVLDIYFVGKDVSQKNIRSWAEGVNIPQKIINKQVTLNYGNDRFDEINKGKSVNLPFVGIVHHHAFQPITLSSIL